MPFICFCYNLPKYKTLDTEAIIKMIDNNNIKKDEKIKPNSINKYYQHIYVLDIQKNFMMNQN